MSIPHRSQPLVPLDTQVTIPRTVLFQTLGTEAILLNLKTATYFGLDPLGTRIWQLLQAGRSVRTIRDSLLDEFEVDKPHLTRDLLRLLQTLAEGGLIECT